MNIDNEFNVEKDLFNVEKDLFNDLNKVNFVKKINIKIQARSGKKSITSVVGLPENLDLKKLLKTFKKIFNCNGSITNDEEFGLVIQLQGDQRINIKDFLVKENICVEDDIIIQSK